MGYLGLAVVFTLIVGIANAVFVLSPLGGSVTQHAEKTLKVTIPEDLDYYSTFDDLFAQYTTKAGLAEAKTTNMGALYQLTYNIVLKDASWEKNLLDDIRCRNGNLSVACGRPATAKERL